MWSAGCYVIHMYKAGSHRNVSRHLPTFKDPDALCTLCTRPGKAQVSTLHCGRAVDVRRATRA